MRMYDVIQKKRDGGILSKDEIEFFVNGYTKGEIPDYQMSALLMAIYMKGMNETETTELTLAMADSGDRMDLSAIKGIKVDKHSTGGVGDKTTLIIGPILASLGIPVAKMSGRGLGHTGGTIDKLESIEGFRTNISVEEFIENVNDIHFALAGQTKNLAPADKKIYALRDVTATVDNMSLIASSIMSKKLASGADAICLDVKCGSGAFMKTLPDAEELARIMVKIGNNAGRKVTALITDMNEPLGKMVGNNLEVIEAIEVLSGKGERRITEVSLNLAAEIIILSGYFDEHPLDEIKATVDEYDICPGMDSLFIAARNLAKSKIDDGSAKEKLAEFVARQGGNRAYIDDISLFEKAKVKLPVYSKNDGYIVSCNNEEVGNASVILGGGREKIGDAIDFAVGIECLKHIGDFVSKSEPFLYIYANDMDKANAAKERLIEAYEISESAENIEKHVVYKLIK